MATKDGFPPDDHFPLFLFEHAEEPEQPGILKAWDRAVIASRILKDRYFDCNGGGNRVRGSVGGKSSRAPCERHGFAGRQICASAWHRSVDANNSINRRRSGFAADNRGRADGRQHCCRF